MRIVDGVLTLQYAKVGDEWESIGCTMSSRTSTGVTNLFETESHALGTD